MKTNVLIVVLLAFFAGSQIIKAPAGIDFYHFWGVSKAQTFSSHKLASPYKEPAQYAEVLTAYADGSSDLRLRAANRYHRDTLGLTHTPLLYSLFALLPENYSIAFVVYRVVLVFAFIASIMLLGAISSGKRRELLALAILLVSTWGPFQSEIRVGNCDSLQLFLLVLLAVFAERVLGRTVRKPLGPSIVFACGLVFFTLFKPNVSLVALFLATHLWVVSGTLVFAEAVSVGVLFGIALGAVTSIKFGSWWVWLDWYDYLKHYYDAAKLMNLVPQGNFSTVILLSQALKSSVSAVTVILACAMFVSVAIAMLMSLPKNGRGVRSLMQVVGRSLSDPVLCAAGGVTITLALAPLVWFHYYVLSIFPAVWLLSSPQPWKYAGLAGGVSILLSSNVVTPYFDLLRGSGGLVPYDIAMSWIRLVPYVIAMSWIPLWIGWLAALSGVREPLAMPTEYRALDKEAGGRRRRAEHG